MPLSIALIALAPVLPVLGKQQQHMHAACLITLSGLQISYYDISRGVYDLAGRVKVTGTMGVPLCLSSAVGEKTEQENIIYGDDSGAAIMLQCGRGELPARVLKPGDFIYVHDDHSDWVTQVRLQLAEPCTTPQTQEASDTDTLSKRDLVCTLLLGMYDVPRQCPL